MCQNVCNQMWFPGANPLYWWGLVFLLRYHIEGIVNQNWRAIYVSMRWRLYPTKQVVLFHDTQSNDAHIRPKLFLSLHVMNGLMGGTHILYCIEKWKVKKLPWTIKFKLNSFSIKQKSEIIKHNFFSTNAYLVLPPVILVVEKINWYKLCITCMLYCSWIQK